MSLVVGKFQLSAIVVPEGEKPPYHEEPHIWIEHESGEAMSTKVANLESAIAQFFASHF